MWIWRQNSYFAVSIRTVMNANQQLIQKFYTAFAAGDAEGMAACYTNDVKFCDPAFGPLKGDDAKNMWRMLLKNNTGIKITASDIDADEITGSAKWVAVYIFSRTGRRVTNHVSAEFEFRDGKISKHTDTFNIWKWAGQAMGVTGWLLGWTPFMKGKIRTQTATLLGKFKANQSAS